jgi:hypothetical protein
VLCSSESPVVCSSAATSSIILAPLKVDLLNAGGGASPNLNTLVKLRSLTHEENADLEMLLKALTGEPCHFSFYPPN